MRFFAKPTRKRKKGPIAKKLDLRKMQQCTTEKLPSYVNTLRPGTEVYSKLKSLDTSIQSVARASVMDPRELDKESKEVRDKIIAKSKRIGITCHKSSYQYITDETDLKTIQNKVAN